MPLLYGTACLTFSLSVSVNHNTPSVRGLCLHHVGLGLFNHLPKLTALVHFYHNVTTTNELAGNVKLGDGGPLAEILDALSDALVGQDVDGLKVNAEAGKNLDRRVGEAALGEDLGPLHKQQDGVAIYQSLDAFLSALRVRRKNGMVCMCVGM